MTSYKIVVKIFHYDSERKYGPSMSRKHITISHNPNHNIHELAPKPHLPPDKAMSPKPNHHKPKQPDHMDTIILKEHYLNQASHKEPDLQGELVPRDGDQRYSLL